MQRNPDLGRTTLQMQPDLDAGGRHLSKEGPSIEACDGESVTVAASFTSALLFLICSRHSRGMHYESHSFVINLASQQMLGLKALPARSHPRAEALTRLSLKVCAPSIATERPVVKRAGRHYPSVR